MINDNFILPKDMWQYTEPEKKCKLPCIKMANKVYLKAENKPKLNENHNVAYLIINFKDTVKIEQKVVVYTFFNFIIDVGSSLGLWLGLSALGITDLAIDAFIMVTKWIKVK